MSMFNTLDLLIIFSIRGNAVLSHHFETVDGFTSDRYVNYYIVHFLSTNTNFKRLISIVYYL
jgi:hypothetical protein